METHPPAHLNLKPIDEFNQKMSDMPLFDGLRTLPEGRFSVICQMTGKDY